MATILAVLAQVSVAAGGLTAGRTQSLAGLAIASIGAIVGWLAVARSTGGRQHRRGVVAALAGLIGVVLAVRHLTTASGAIGTGSGKLGAIVALLVAMFAAALGGLAVARARRR
jgi:hypothetical protein